MPMRSMSARCAFPAHAGLAMCTPSTVALGCQEKGLAAPDCYGLQADLVLRVAVMTVRGQTMVVWERIAASASTDLQTADMEAFQRMLDTVSFR